MVEEMNNIGTNPEPDYRSSAPLPTPSKEDIKKNGFYYECLSEQERPYYEAARECEGMQEEICLVRAKIQYIQTVYPANLGLLFRAISLLERIIKTQRLVFHKHDDTNFEEQLTRVCEKLQLPLELMRNGLKDSPVAA
jgi:hypothetical protein